MNVRAIGIREDLAEILYQTLTEGFGAKTVTIEANLYEAFGMVDDELDMVVTDVANKAQLRLPGAEETSGMPAIETVKDLLLFIEGLSSAT